MTAAPEPANFDVDVRQRGLGFLATGAPKSAQTCWTRALPQLRAAHEETCAYLGMRISPATAYATVDHFRPKVLFPQEAYEWSNFRLASIPINTNKRDKIIPVDPFSVHTGEFALNVVSGDVEVGVSARPQDIDDTIRLLGLNDDRFPTERLGYIDDYLNSEITVAYLLKWFPFGHSELERQGLL